MKKIILVLFLMIVLFACDNSSNNYNAPEIDQDEPSGDYRVVN